MIVIRDVVDVKTEVQQEKRDKHSFYEGVSRKNDEKHVVSLQ